MITQPKAAFVIGTPTWPGVAKLIEELGELQQVLGKLIAFPDGPHPDGTDLVDRLHDEIADISAAIDFVIIENQLDGYRIALRSILKLRRFKYWHRGGQGLPESERNDSPK